MRRASGSNDSSMSSLSISSGRADASSSAVVMVVNGLRSSWEASLISRCWAARPFSSLPSMAFMVVASWAISSRAPGTGTRCARSVLEIDATRARIASTGRNAAPTSR